MTRDMDFDQRSEVQRQADRLADRLLDDLKSGRVEKIGLDDIEAAAADIIAPLMDQQLYRALVDWTMARLMAAK